MVMSSPLAGALITTFWAPASMCFEALSRSVNSPVDSTTISTPSSFHGRLAGSRSAVTRIGLPSMTRSSPSARTSPSNLPSTESYFNRWASVLVSVMSFTETTSKSAPCFLAARRKFRPIRPKPLIPILTVMVPSLDRPGGDGARRSPHPILGAARGTGYSRPGSARASASFEIAMGHRHPMALRPEVLGEFLGDDDGPVASARAPHADCQIGLALPDVPGHRRVQERPEPADELVVSLLLLDVGPHALVRPGERPQPVHPVRVRQEPDVEHEVGVPGQTILVPERDQRDLQHRLRRGLGEQHADAVAELVGGHPRGVDDEVGVALERLHHQALLADALDHPVRGS